MAAPPASLLRSFPMTLAASTCPGQQTISAMPAAGKDSPTAPRTAGLLYRVPDRVGRLIKSA